MNAVSTWPPEPECRGARQWILVVEDELLIRFMVSEGLRDVGYSVIEACDADEALAMLQTVVPDLIISDVRMPGSVDGLGLLNLLRKSHPSVPVILVSGHLERDRAFAQGASHFLAKPFTIEHVIEAVQTELAKLP